MATQQNAMTQAEEMVSLHGIYCDCERCLGFRKDNMKTPVKFDIVTDEQMAADLRRNRSLTTYSALQQALRDNKPGTILRVAAASYSAKQTAANMYQWAGKQTPRVQLRTAYDRASETLYIWIEEQKA